MDSPDHIPDDFTWTISDRYVVMDRIGTGGMAEIFRAKMFGAAGFEKEFAVKLIRPHLLDDEEFVEMFVNEAKLSVALYHTNIVQVFDFGIHDERYYIVMEYVEGKDLLDILARCVNNNIRIPLDIGLHIVMELLKGLDFAHRATDVTTGELLNIIHRDISPSNILVSYAGGVKVGDFGVAKAKFKQSRSRTGTLKGKVGYMSPEQVIGDPIDYRSDIFAAGIILYETISMARLFRADNDFGTMLKVRDCDIDSALERTRPLPSELERIVRKALSKEITDRYQTAGAFYQDLAGFCYANRLIIDNVKVSNLMRRLFSADIERQKKKRTSENNTLQALRATSPEHPPSVSPPPPSKSVLDLPDIPSHVEMSDSSYQAPYPSSPRFHTSHIDPKGGGDYSATDIEAQAGSQGEKIDSEQLLSSMRHPHQQDASPQIVPRPPDPSLFEDDEEETLPPKEVLDAAKHDDDEPGAQTVGVPLSAFSPPPAAIKPPDEADVEKLVAPSLPLHKKSTPSIDNDQTVGPSFNDDKTVMPLLAPNHSSSERQFKMTAHPLETIGPFEGLPKQESVDPFEESAMQEFSEAFAPGESGIKGDTAPEGADFDFDFERSEVEDSVATNDSTLLSDLNRETLKPLLAPYMEKSFHYRDNEGRIFGPLEGNQLIYFITSAQNGTISFDASGWEPIAEFAERIRSAHTPPPKEEEEDIYEATVFNREANEQTDKGQPPLTKQPPPSPPLNKRPPKLSIPEPPPVRGRKPRPPSPADAFGKIMAAASELEELSSAESIPNEHESLAAFVSKDSSRGPFYTTSKERENAHQGSLSKVSFTRLLYRIIVSEQTGRLILTSGLTKKELYFEKGRPVSVMSNLDHERIGDFLIERRLITQEQLNDALKRSEQWGGRVGDSLVANNAIPAFQIVNYLRMQFEEKLLEIFAWEKGSYQFFENQVTTDRNHALNVDLLRLIADGCMNRVPFDLIVNFYKNRERKPIFLNDKFNIGVDRFKLSIAANRMLHNYKSGDTLSQILSQPSLDQGELAYRVFYLMHQVEYIRFENTHRVDSPGFYFNSQVEER